MTRYALISVFDKSGIEAFARELIRRGFQLISSGGSAAALREAGIRVEEVSALTGFPEMLGGRVKTLHPLIHGGILARRACPEDLETLKEHQIPLIDLVCVNLYPFEKVLSEGADNNRLIEMIDIGGPTLLRAAAKNHRDVIVLSDPSDYPLALRALDESDAAKALAIRQQLAQKVFARTSRYDALIADWFLSQEKAENTPEEDTSCFPRFFHPQLEKVEDLRYGENPHQKAAFYRYPDISDISLAAAEQLQGKELSYNNLQDGNAALEVLAEFDKPCVVALKHMTPCGLATANTAYRAWQKAWEADPVSIFGGIVALNREVSAEMAEEMCGIFLELIIAPSYAPEALKTFQKKKNLRVLRLPMTEKMPRQRFAMKSLNDGLLLQDLNLRKVLREDCRPMGRYEVSEADWDDLLEGFSVVKHVKSNAVVLYKDGVTVGVGAGQPNRVGACEIALKEAGDKAKGAILASDAFFPMPDTVELAIKAGIRAIIQPGGSIRDQDSIAVCDAAGIPMLATGVRHFKH